MPEKFNIRRNLGDISAEIEPEVETQDKQILLIAKVCTIMFHYS